MRLKCLMVVSSLVSCVLSGCFVAEDADSAANPATAAMPTVGSSVSPAPGPGVASDEDDAEEEVEIAWDYEPYRVLVWLVSDDPAVTSASMGAPLRAYLDRYFAAVWRLEIADAPAPVHSAAARDLGGLSYDSITAADPVLAVKRDHPDAVRIRIARNVGEYVTKVYATKERIAEVREKAKALDNESVDGVDQRLEVVDGDSIAVRDLWSKPETEALLVSRGLAMTLTEPEAKVLTPTIGDLVSEAVERYDKIFVARIQTDAVPFEVDVVELDTLMRHFGPVASAQASSFGSLHVAIGEGLTKAFAPVVRIENAGQKSAVGLLRAGGLILERDRETSPAFVRVGDVLEPMTRKDDRNGKPIMIGPMDWAYLLVTELTGHGGRNVEMDFFAGRAGGLQGRKNKRTFRMALRVRAFGESTTLRLHLQKDPDFPLIGYELYEKELDSTSMTFIGRTDWNGRLLVKKSDKPLQLLYVKNGGAVLARLPIVPGLNPDATADLSGDDMRLQAEAYIRGVQNSIIDLVAIRELFKARIRMRLERGEMTKAEELLTALRNQPSSDKLYDEIGKRHALFINELGSGNGNQRRKVDEMFSTTRELLAKYITPKLVRDLESDMIAAAKNGGKLPVESDESSDDEPDAMPPAAQPQSETPQSAPETPSDTAEQTG